ncbi:MAG: GDYXXLXY domain-containing protein [Pseudomonadota bacterium]|nr:GDYXXLXY domain-containing protein [Pseudomonadota bacterium]
MSTRIWIALGLLLVFGLVNISIWQKEQLWSNGQTLLLPLAPVDPRSLMQGDYMILRYALADQLAAHTGDARHRLVLPTRGQLLVTVDQEQVVQAAQLDQGQSLKTDQYRLQYRYHNGEIWLGAESFFFQEGHAQHYEQARFGELRVDPKGHSILVGLRDQDRQPIRKPDTNAL